MSITDDILEFFGVRTKRYNSLESECKAILFNMKKDIKESNDRIKSIDNELANLRSRQDAYEQIEAWQHEHNIRSEKFHLESKVRDFNREIVSLEKRLSSNPTTHQLKLGIFFARTAINASRLGHSIMRSLQSNHHSMVDFHMALYNAKQEILIQQTI